MWEMEHRANRVQARDISTDTTSVGLLLQWHGMALQIRLWGTVRDRQRFMHTCTHHWLFVLRRRLSVHGAGVWSNTDSNGEATPRNRALMYHFAFTRCCTNNVRGSEGHLGREL